MKERVIKGLHVQPQFADIVKHELANARRKFYLHEQYVFEAEKMGETLDEMDEKLAAQRERASAVLSHNAGSTPGHQALGYAPPGPPGPAGPRGERGPPGPPAPPAGPAPNLDPLVSAMQAGFAEQRRALERGPEQQLEMEARAMHIQAAKEVEKREAVARFEAQLAGLKTDIQRLRPNAAPPQVNTIHHHHHAAAQNLAVVNAPQVTQQVALVNAPQVNQQFNTQVNVDQRHMALINQHNTTINAVQNNQTRILELHANGAALPDAGERGLVPVQNTAPSPPPPPSPGAGRVKKKMKAIAGSSRKPLAIEDQPALPPPPPPAAPLAIEDRKPLPKGTKSEKPAGLVSKKSQPPPSQRQKVSLSSKFTKRYKDKPRPVAPAGVPELEPPMTQPPAKKQKTGRASRRAVGSIREVAV